MTKRPKLLPQVPLVAAATNTRDLSNHQHHPQQQQQYPQQTSSHSSAAYINESAEPGFSTTSPFDVYGAAHVDPYSTSDCSALPLPYDIDNEYEYECETAATAQRPAAHRTRRKVLPSAPKHQQQQQPVAVSSQYDEFENEPLSYNSQPPSKIDDR